MPRWAHILAAAVHLSSLAVSGTADAGGAGPDRTG
jgi:hypothetical protein